MAIVISERDGVTVRHIVEKGITPTCAVNHDAKGKPQSKRNTPALRLRSERCRECFSNYTSREKKDGTFEHSYAKPEPQRLAAAVKTLTPEERSALQVSRYARAHGMTPAKAKAILAEIERTAEKKSATPKSTTKTTSKAPAKKSAKVANRVAEARARKPEAKPAASVAQSAAAAIATGANAS